MLEVRQLTVAYGQIVAADGIDLEVKPGEIVALVGANGAGKSSLMMAIAGLIPASGSVRLGGQDFSELSAPDRVARGLVHVLEQRGTFAELTVQENLDLGAYLRRRKGGGATMIARDLDFVFGMFPRLKERRANRAGSLSGGEQQMLVIGRALMAAPQLLMLDEPSLGLAPIVVNEIAKVLRRLNAERGLTLLVSEQNSVLGLGLSHRAYVIQRGRIALSGDSAELRHRGDVIQFYLGHNLAAPRNESRFIANTGKV
jgi:branched-chain amino acid transport system ATP-binding protein